MSNKSQIAAQKQVNRYFGFLSHVYAQIGVSPKILKMGAMMKQHGISGTASAVIRKLGLVENRGQKGTKGALWAWTGDVPSIDQARRVCDDVSKLAAAYAAKREAAVAKPAAPVVAIAATDAAAAAEDVGQRQMLTYLETIEKNQHRIMRAMGLA